MTVMFFDLQRFASYTNYNNYNVVGGSAYNDSIYNSGNYSTISAGNGNDTVNNNNGYYSSIIGGDGADSINNYDGDNVTINAGAGNDFIINNWSYRASINGGAGADTISLVSGQSGVSVRGGAGNDVIYGSTNTSYGVLYQFYSGDGYDKIYNWNSNDTLNLGGAHFKRSTVSGNVIVSLASGAVTLDSASNKTVNITNGIEDKGVTLNNTISGATLYGTSYIDSITNSGATVKIYTYDGNDTIINSGNRTTIYSGDGDDTISTNNSSYSSIQAGSGNDSIFCRSNYSTVNGDDGDDTISNITYYSSINGGAGSDYIYNYSYYSTINGGAGNDKISLYSEASNNIIQLGIGDGFDTVYGYHSTDNISLPSYAYYTRETVNNSNVLIKLQSGGSLLLNGAADKTISVIGGILTTPGGKSISSSASNVTLTGTNYADTLKNLGGSNVLILGNNGNDTLYNSGGNRITILGGDGADTINDAFAETISIDGGYGNDSIYGNNNYATIQGGAGYDTIVGNHWRSKIYGGTENDLISLTSYWYNTLDGGSGNDSIYAGGSQHSVNGGDGNDLISLTGSMLTIAGGKGNDIIYGSTATSHLYQYNVGDGNDTIYNLSSNDTITVTGGNVTTKTSGKNILVNIGNSATISLVGAKGTTLNINGKIINPAAEDDRITQQDVIKKFMKSLDTDKINYNSWDSNSVLSAGKKVLDNAVNAASSKFSTVDEVITAIYKDCQSYGVDGASRFLLEKCGIDLNNKDTGAITGYNAGGSSQIINGEDIIPEDGTKNSYNLTAFDVSDGNKDYGLKITLADNRPNKDQKHIWDCLYTWWAKESLELIENSYGYSFTDSDATTHNLSFEFMEGSKYKAETDWTPDGNNLRIGVYTGIFNNFAEDDYNCKSINNNSNGYLDRTISHELTHAIMMAKVYNFYCLPQFITEGLADLTHGTEDTYRGPMMLALAKDPDAFKSYLSLKPGTGNNYSYAAGFVFLRYLAKQSSYLADIGGSSFEVAFGPNSLPAGTSMNKSTLTVSKKFKGNLIDLSEYDSTLKNINATSSTKNLNLFGTSVANSLTGGKGDDQLFGEAGNDTLRGGTSDDMLSGGSGNDKLYGDSGNDSLYAGLGNDTLTGGKGNDIFAYESGADVLTDYKPGYDKIKILSGSIVSSSVNGKDVVLETEEGSILVKSGAGKKITVIDAEDNENASVYGALALTDKSSVKVTLDADVQSADASGRTTKIKITGNSLANTIQGGKGNDSLYGGKGNDSLVGSAGNDKLYGQSGNDKLYGGDGNDSLTGGTGNDSLWGGDGADKFFYSSGDGKDVIYGFENDDLLKITGTFSASYSKSKGEVYFKVGSTSKAITLSDFTASSFHVNDSTYHINSKDKFVKK